MKKILIHTATLLVFLVGCNSNPEESKIDYLANGSSEWIPTMLAKVKCGLMRILLKLFSFLVQWIPMVKGNPLPWKQIGLAESRTPIGTVRPYYAPFHDPENVRIPFWLQPEKKYTGAAWYRRLVNIPKTGSATRYFLIWKGHTGNRWFG
jgi:hypothetical protein